MKDNYDIRELNPRKNPYVVDKATNIDSGNNLGENMRPEYDFSDATKNPYLNASDKAKQTN